MTDQHIHKCQHEGKHYDNPQNVASSKAFADDIKTWIPIKNDMVLFDFGAGTGQIGMNFAPDVSKVIFEDVSDKMLEQLQKNCEEKNITNYSIFNGFMEDYHGEKVDIITAGMVLHHVEDLDSLFQAFIATLKPHGRLCIIDFLPGAAFFTRMHVKMPHLGFEPTELIEQLKKNGFVQAELKPALPLSHLQEDGTNEVYQRFALIAEAP